LPRPHTRKPLPWLKPRKLAKLKPRKLARGPKREKEERRNREIHQKRFEAALVPLNVWFPGVKWEYEIGGDFFCNDTIIFEQGEYPPPFKLKAVGPVNPGKHMEFEVGDYHQDSSMPGYTYWSGTKVKSAADLGRYLVNRDKKK
jgi:hypothetical protein